MLIECNHCTYEYDGTEPIEVGDRVKAVLNGKVKEMKVTKIGSDYKGPVKMVTEVVHE